jgi:hypothetical protein
MKSYWESRYQGERVKIAAAFATALADRDAFEERPAAVALIALGRAAPSMFEREEEIAMCLPESMTGTARVVLERLKARVAAIPSPPLSPGAVEIHFPALVLDHLARAVMAPVVSGRALASAREHAIEAMTDAVYYLAVQIAVKESTSTRFVRLPPISGDVFMRAFKRVLDPALAATLEDINTACVARTNELFPGRGATSAAPRSHGLGKLLALGLGLGVVGAVVAKQVSSKRSAA